MKKKVFLSTMIFSMMFVSFETMAHGICRTRQSCNGLGWTRKAHAAVWMLGVPKTRSHKRCKWDNVSPGNASGNDDVVASVSNACAYQMTINNWQQGCLKLGSVYRWKRICARGKEYSSLFQNVYIKDEDMENTLGEGYEKSETGSKSIYFNGDHIRIDSINGFMETKGKSMFSSYEIRIWLPTSEMDTLETEAKTLIYGKLKLINGKLVKEGFFKDHVIRVSTNRDGAYRVDLKNIMLNFKLPEGITSDMVEVMSVSDGGTDEEDAFENKVQTDKVNFKIFPNPVSDVLNLYSQDIKSGTYKLNVYDVSGKSIKVSLNEIEMNRFESTSISLNELGDLKPGIYYVLIENSTEKYMSKFIVR